MVEEHNANIQYVLSQVHSCSDLVREIVSGERLDSRTFITSDRVVYSFEEEGIFAYLTPGQLVPTTAKATRWPHVRAVDELSLRRIKESPLVQKIDLVKEKKPGVVTVDKEVRPFGPSQPTNVHVTGYKFNLERNVFFGRDYDIHPEDEELLGFFCGDNVGTYLRKLLPPSFSGMVEHLVDRNANGGRIHLNFAHHRHINNWMYTSDDRALAVPITFLHVPTINTSMIQAEPRLNYDNCFVRGER